MSDSILQLGSVGVVTTTNGGLPPEYWAKRAAEQIISVGDQAPAPLLRTGPCFQGADRVRCPSLHATSNPLTGDTLMAFSGSALCTSFKQEILVGTHNFTASSGNTFKLALYTNSASLNGCYDCLLNK